MTRHTKLIDAQCTLRIDVPGGESFFGFWELRAQATSTQAKLKRVTSAIGEGNNAACSFYRTKNRRGGSQHARSIGERIHDDEYSTALDKKEGTSEVDADIANKWERKRLLEFCLLAISPCQISRKANE